MRLKRDVIFVNKEFVVIVKSIVIGVILIVVQFVFQMKIFAKYVCNKIWKLYKLLI